CRGWPGFLVLHRDGCGPGARKPGFPLGTAPTMSRDPKPLRSTHTRAACLGLSAAILLVPANVLPVLHTRIAGEVRTDTIFSGVVELWESGLWAIATIVFIASFLVPLAKLAGLTWLILAARRGARHPRRLA